MFYFFGCVASLLENPGLVLLRDLWFRLDRSGEGADFLLGFSTKATPPPTTRKSHPGSWLEDAPSFPFIGF